MRFSFFLAAIAVLSGCSITSTTTGGEGAVGGPGVSIVRLSTPDHCGIDFADETDEAAKSEFLSSIDGEWMQYVQAYERTSCSDNTPCFRKPGFVFDAAKDEVGNVEYRFREMADDEEGAFTKFDERSPGSFKIRNLRVSQPLANAGSHDGDRFLSFYDTASEYCWSYAIGRRGRDLSVRYVDIIHTDSPLLSVEDAKKLIGDRQSLYRHLDLALIAGDAPTAQTPAPSTTQPTTPPASQPSTADRCGFDFVEENVNERLSLLADLEGNWLSTTPGFSKIGSVFVKDGFAVYLNTFTFGLIQYRFPIPVPEIKGFATNATTTKPTLDLSHFRLSRPLLSHDGVRLMSAFNRKANMCATFAIKISSADQIEVSYPVHTLGPLQPASGFFTNGAGLVSFTKQ